MSVKYKSYQILLSKKDGNIMTTDKCVALPGDLAETLRQLRQ